MVHRVRNRSEVIMKRIDLAGCIVVLGKIKTNDDVLYAAGHVFISGATRVVCLDMGTHPNLEAFVDTCVTAGLKLVICDHADVIKDTAKYGPYTRQEETARAAVVRLYKLCGGGHDIRISNHREHPACSMLVQEGEFTNLHGKTVIFADMDTDGLMSVLKGIGWVYPKFNRDAEVLSGPMEARTAENLTAWAHNFHLDMETAKAAGPRGSPERAAAREQAILQAIETAAHS